MLPKAGLLPIVFCMGVPIVMRCFSVLISTDLCVRCVGIVIEGKLTYPNKGGIGVLNQIKTLKELANKLRADVNECGHYSGFRKNKLMEQVTAIDWAVEELEKIAEREGVREKKFSKSIFDEPEWRDKL